MKKIEKLLMLLIALTTFSLVFNVKADMYSGMVIREVNHGNIYIDKDEMYSFKIIPTGSSFLGLVSITPEEGLETSINGNTVTVVSHEIGQKELKIKWNIEAYYPDTGSSEPIRHEDTCETTIKVTVGIKFKGANADNSFTLTPDTQRVDIELADGLEGVEIMMCTPGDKTEKGCFVETLNHRYQKQLAFVSVEYNYENYNLPIELDLGYSIKLDKLVNKTLKNYNIKPDEFFTLSNSWHSFQIDSFNISRQNNTECTVNEDSTYSCPVTVSSWSDNISVDTEIAGRIYGLVPKKQSALEWDYSYKFEDTLISFYGQKSDDIYCYSSDSSIISVEKCKMTAKKYGTATIYAFNTKTLESTKIKVNYTPSPGYDFVDFSSTSINEFLDSLPDEITIDYKEEYANYDTLYAYINKFRAMFNDYFKTDAYININTQITSESSAIFTFSVWDSLRGEQKEYETKEITFKYVGLKLITPFTYVEVLSEDNLTYIDALEGTEDVEILYDPNFVELTTIDDITAIKFIKSGYVDISLKKGDYVNTYTITVGMSTDLLIGLKNYLDSIETINLPFSKDGFKNNLDSLKNLISKYVYENLPDNLESYADDLDAKVVCYDETLCSVSLGMKELSYSETSNIEIKYDDTNTDFSKLDFEPIKLSFDDYIKEVYKANGDKDTYYSNLRLMYQNKLSQMTDVSPKFNVNVGCDAENPEIQNEINGLYGDYLTNLNVSYDGYAIYNGKYGVIANKVLTIPMDNKLSYAEYVKNYMDNLFDKDTTVTSITKDVYRVNFGTFNIDVVVNPIDAVPVASIYGINKKLITINKNDTYQIELEFGPDNYNIDPEVTYEVEDETIASIDATGKVTGLKDGITLVKCTLKNTNWPSYAYAFVGVGKTQADIVNYYFEKYVPTDITINYGYYNSLEQEIQSRLYNVYDYSLSSNFIPDVELHDNDYYVAINYNDYTYGTLITTDYKKLNITFKGIYTKERNYFLSPGDVVDTEYYFTEGSKKNVTYRIDNKEVATFDLETGEIKALKKGATQIYLMDSKGVYNTTLNVYIDYDAYIEELLNSVDVIEIDANEAKRNGNHNAFYSAIQNELNLYSNGLDRLNVGCDETTCTMLALDKQDKEYRKTYKYVKTGIVFEDEEIEMNAGDSKLLEYTRYPSTSDKEIDYKVYTLGDYGNDVCEYDGNDIIKTHVPGGCIIVAKNPDSKYTSTLTITVGKDIIINDLNTLVNKLPNEMDINATPDALLNDYGEETDAFISFIQNAFRKELNLDSSYWFSLDYTKFASDREVEVKITRNFIVDRPEEMLYASVSVSSETSKTVKLKFKDSVDEGEYLDEILDSLKPKYELSLLDYLKYRLDENRNMAEHSDFGRTIESYPGYTFLYEAHGGYGGPDGEGQIGVYALLYDGGFIKSGTVEFNVDYTTNDIGNLSQDEFIEELKKIVGNAYNEASNSITPTSSIENTYTIKLLGANLLGAVDASDVDIAFAGISQGGKELYDVDVKDISFVLGVTRASSKDYIIDVKDIKLSKTNLTLNIGSTETITATVTPSDATNKDITWSSSNANIATVSNGKITAKAAGTATITVKSADGSVTKKITVTVQGDTTKGDANGDGKVNINDVIILRKYLAGLGDVDSKYRNNADATGDGKININDVIKIRKYLAGIERL